MSSSAHPTSSGEKVSIRRSSAASGSRSLRFDGTDFHGLSRARSPPGATPGPGSRFRRPRRLGEPRARVEVAVGVDVDDVRLALRRSAAGRRVRSRGSRARRRPPAPPATHARLQLGVSAAGPGGLSRHSGDVRLPLGLVGDDVRAGRSNARRSGSPSAAAPGAAGCRAAARRSRGPSMNCSTSAGCWKVREHPRHRAARAPARSCTTESKSMPTRGVLARGLDDEREGQVDRQRASSALLHHAKRGRGDAAGAQHLLRLVLVQRQPQRERGRARVRQRRSRSSRQGTTISPRLSAAERLAEVDDQVRAACGAEPRRSPSGSSSTASGSARVAVPVSASRERARRPAPRPRALPVLGRPRGGRGRGCAG